MKIPRVRFLHSPPKDVSARVTKSAVESISNGTETALAFDQEDFDTHAQHDNSTNNERLTCKIAGKYLITASAQFAANGTGQRFAWIRHGGSTKLAGTGQDAGASEQTRLSVSTIYELAVGEYVEVTVWQNSGGALNIQTNLTHLTMAKIRG